MSDVDARDVSTGAVFQSVRIERTWRVVYEDSPDIDHFQDDEDEARKWAAQWPGCRLHYRDVRITTESTGWTDAPYGVSP